MIQGGTGCKLVFLCVWEVRTEGVDWVLRGETSDTNLSLLIFRKGHTDLSLLIVFKYVYMMYKHQQQQNSK